MISLANHRTLLLSLLLASLAFVILRILAADWSDDFRTFEFVSAQDGQVVTVAAAPDAKTLAVVVHAYTRDRQAMYDIVRRLEMIDPAIDVIAPEYQSHAFSNTDTNTLSAHLDRRIQALVDRSPGKYERIVLVGHSIGAMLVKRAYLFGNGCGSAYPLESPVPTTCGDSMARDNNWVRLVETGRIVLLAGMNNGWSINPRPRDMRKTRWLTLKYGTLLGALTGTARMSRGIRRGSPFVSNLRYDWIRLARSLPHCEEGSGGRCVAQVVQILGDNDDIVSRADSMDLTTTDGFVFMEALGTFHSTVIQLFPEDCEKDGAECDDDVRSNPEFIEQRRRLFTDAISKPLNWLRAEYQFNDPVQERGVKRVVFVAHGIRDIGEWTSTFKRELEREDTSTQVVPIRYGYFGMIEFLFRWDRQQYVRWFVEQYIEAYVKYPDLAEVSFIGHSNGTYLLASALEQYALLHFDNVYFAGSVVRRDFPWTDFLGDRVGRLRNDMGAGDGVVATLPRIFEFLSILPFTGSIFDLGSGGFAGFEKIPETTDEPTRYLEVGQFPGGHSAPLETRANLQSIKAFVMRGAMTAPQGRVPHNKIYHYLLLFLWAVPLIWLLIGAVIVGLGWLVWQGADRVSDSRTVVKVLALAGYMIAFPVAINLL